MSDLISRQALCEYALNQKNKSITPNDIMRFPSAQPYLDEWCTDCKEYDKERNCCPRWNRIIRETVNDAHNEGYDVGYWAGRRDYAPQWISCSEKLPEDDTEVIVSCTDDSGDSEFSYTTIGWHFKGIWVVCNERSYFVRAWMPLPEAWKGERDE